MKQNETAFFRARKEEYRHKVIDYQASPTGRAYVGINKTPFMPAADKGHGFQGVLMQDDNREFVQCHACGEWMGLIGNKHLESCSGMTVRQYKEKYGLNKDQGLVSDETSLRLTKAALKNKAGQKSILKYGGKFKPRKGWKKPMDYFNRYGTCPLQLKTRLYEFIRNNRELPGQGNRGRPIYKALVKRYGSFGHALAAHGLPWMRRQGTTMQFAFPDGTVHKYNLNQFYDREALFNLMMEKCPVLSQKA